MACSCNQNSNCSSRCNCSPCRSQCVTGCLDIIDSSCIVYSKAVICNSTLVLPFGSRLQVVLDTIFAQLCALNALLPPVDEPWKTIGTMGNMANGQPIPSFEARYTNSSGYKSMQLRKTADGKIALRGNIKVVLGAPGTLFQLPVGYTVATDASSSFMGYNTSDGSLITARIANSGGWVYIEGGTFVADDELAFPEWVFSRD